MSTMMTKSYIFKKAGRFNDLNECKKEPVTKIPLDLDIISGLQWNDDEPVVDSVKIFMVNNFFVLNEKSATEVKELKNIAAMFSPQSLKEFTETFAEELMKASKGRDTETKLIKKALIVFGLIGSDESLYIFYKGKIYSLKHRRGIRDSFKKALSRKKSPFTELLLTVLRVQGKDSWFWEEDPLTKIKRIRKIFTKESVLPSNNKIKQNKDLKKFKLSLSVRKSAEKLIADFYLDFTEDSMLVFRDLSYEEWKMMYIDDICGFRICRSMLWGVYDRQELVRVFAVNLDGQIVDNAGEEIHDFEFGDLGINLVHPVEMTGENIDSWRKYFSKIKIKQLIAQLDRQVFCDDDQNFESYINQSGILPERYWKRKMGKWIPRDFEGFIMAFKKTVSIKSEERLSIEIVTAINRSSPDDEPSSLEEIKVTFLRRHEHDVVLGELPPRMYSEICRDIEKYFMRK